MERNEVAPKYTTIHNYETVGHQIDTLFVSQHFILLLEIRNVSGRIWYDVEKYQFLREKKSGENESFQELFEQVKRHAEYMERLVEHLALMIPVHKVVVIAEPSTIIGEVSGEIPIFHAIGLRTEVNKLLLKYPKPFIGDAHFSLLKNEILQLYKPGVYRPKFEIPPIRKGAICSCGRTMYYENLVVIVVVVQWALIQGVHDDRVLFGEWITNPEFRDFFFIESEDVINKILKRRDFYYEAKNKMRRYFIPKDVWRIN